MFLLQMNLTSVMALVALVSITTSIPWVSIASSQRFCKHLSRHYRVWNFDRISKESLGMKYPSCLRFVEYRVDPTSALANKIFEYQKLITSPIPCSLSILIASLTICWVSNIDHSSDVVEYRVDPTSASTYKIVVEYRISIASPTIHWVLNNHCVLRLGFMQRRCRCLNCGCLLGSLNPCKTKLSSSQ